MPPIHFIADDFGLSDRVNAAIVRAHREGALTGASLMVGQPGSDRAVALARENPGLEIGWHVHLCDSVPVTLPAWPWGAHPLEAGVRVGLSDRSRARLRTELEGQWERFCGTGLRCAFVNSHHHLHLHPWILSEIHRVVSPRFDGWLRGFDFRLFAPSTPTARITHWAGRLLGSTLVRHWPGPRSRAVWGVDRLHRMNAAEVERVVRNFPKVGHEFIFHPSAPEGDAEVNALLQLGASLRRRDRDGGGADVAPP